MGRFLNVHLSNTGILWVLCRRLGTAMPKLEPARVLTHEMSEQEAAQSVAWHHTTSASGLRSRELQEMHRGIIWRSCHEQATSGKTT